VTRRCAAVACTAHSTRVASVSAVATRETARTFDYDNLPAANSPETSGNDRSARATRTCSRPAVSPPLSPPVGRVNSPTNESSRALAAVNWLDSSTISASNRSRGRGCAATAGAGGTSDTVIAV
jgi:hypothetical protein